MASIAKTIKNAAVGVLVAGLAVVTVAATNVTEKSSMKKHQEQANLVFFLLNEDQEWEMSTEVCIPGDDFCGLEYDITRYAPPTDGALPLEVTEKLPPNYQSTPHGDEIGDTGIIVYRKE